eukprot:sb/3465507/
MMFPPNFFFFSSPFSPSVVFSSTSLTRYLGHVTGYQPIRGQYFLIPDSVGSCFLTSSFASSAGLSSPSAAGSLFPTPPPSLTPATLTSRLQPYYLTSLAVTLHPTLPALTSSFASSAGLSSPSAAGSLFSTLGRLVCLKLFFSLLTKSLSGSIQDPKLLEFLPFFTFSSLSSVFASSCSSVVVSSTAGTGSSSTAAGASISGASSTGASTGAAGSSALGFLLNRARKLFLALGFSSAAATSFSVLSLSAWEVIVIEMKTPGHYPPWPLFSPNLSGLMCSCHSGSTTFLSGGCLFCSGGSFFGNHWLLERKCVRLGKHAAAYSVVFQEPTETSKQPIRIHYLGLMTGYQPISDQSFLIRSVPVVFPVQICMKELRMSEECWVVQKHGATLR